jgi:drug/metabolite transporter (DMT)-like permease
MALGVLIAVAAVLAGAVATVLLAGEARSAPSERTHGLALIARLARRPRWLAGAGLMLLAWPLQVCALRFAPIVVVQPILATFFLFLLVLARVSLGERVGALEWSAVVMILAGISAVLTLGPQDAVARPGTGRLALPLAAVGVAAIATCALPRARPGARALLAIGAGLGYAWADFANLLLSDTLSSGRWSAAGMCVLGVLAFGALAFVQENSGLAQWPAVTVTPLIGAVQQPLPVLMALTAGIEVWNSSPLATGALVGGLALVASGAAVLGRSQSVARVAGAA